MQEFEIRGSTGISTIVLGKGIDALPEYTSGARIIVVTDGTVRQLHSSELRGYETIEIGSGEETKTLDTLQGIYTDLLELEADRFAFIAGIGGGVVCDIAGFVASTYLRGVPFGLVPTTLLSQVDAGVGGKNGVNLNGRKNVIGVFNQPRVVLCDPGLLGTLPGSEVRNGLAEAVKHAAIGDKAMFSYLERNCGKALELDKQVIEHLVSTSIQIKSRIVNSDEKETGERRKLNFGHTIGHAIELTCGISHGQAVSIGMMTAAELSVRKGYLKAADAERLRALLVNLGLPTGIRIEVDQLMEVLKGDKKRHSDSVHYVFLRDLGCPVVESLPLRQLAGLLKTVFSASTP